LDSTSGAGRYYSSVNPLISNSGNTGYGNNQYIPHAFGYAYTKTEKKEKNINEKILI